MSPRLTGVQRRPHGGLTQGVRNQLTPFGDACVTVAVSTLCCCNALCSEEANNSTHLTLLFSRRSPAPGPCEASIGTYISKMAEVPAAVKTGADGKLECFVERVVERTPYYQNRVKLFEQYRERWENQRAAAAAEGVKIQVRAAYWCPAAVHSSRLTPPRTSSLVTLGREGIS
jgi:hypothetical protein